MKKSSSKLPTFVLVLSLAIIPPVLSSCKSVESINSNLSTLDVRHSTHTDTLVIRDSIYIREFIKGDTVFRDRVEYRDRWRTQIVHDTVLKTDSIVQVIEHPPERYVPPFYKRCTWALWIIVALAIGYGLLRRYIPRL